MKLDFPPPPPRPASPSGAPRHGTGAPVRSSVRLDRTLWSSARLDRTLWSSALLALLLGCGASSDEDPSEPSGCISDDECAGDEQCVAATCVAPSPTPSMSAGMAACSVVTCPPSRLDCCLGAVATATDNESQGYASRNQMVVRANSVEGAVSAAFSFDAADQQGWLTFELDGSLDLDRVEFTGFHMGAADRFLTVNTNVDRDSGCAFGFDLEPRPSPTNVPVYGDTVEFNYDNFCYGGARPGQASQLAFAIFAAHPGGATFGVYNITLHEE